MKPAPIARFLMDFSAEAGRGAAGDLARGSEGAAQSVEARIAAALAEGLETGKRAGQAELEARLEEQRALTQQQLEAARRTWVGEESDKLANRLAESLTEAETRLAEAASRALKPFLTEAVRRQAIAELAQHLGVLAAREASAALSISGPHDLVAALQDKLAGSGIAIKAVSETDATDVRVVAGPTVLETQIGTWAARLGEALA